MGANMNILGIRIECHGVVSLNLAGSWAAQVLGQGKQFLIKEFLLCLKATRHD